MGELTSIVADFYVKNSIRMQAPFETAYSKLHFIQTPTLVLQSIQLGSEQG